MTVLYRKDPARSNQVSEGTVVKSQDDLMLEDIIQQVLGMEQEPQHIHPAQMEEFIDIEGQQQIDPAQMQQLSQPEGLFEALEQMTGDPEQDETAMDERDFYINFVDEVDGNAQKKIALDLIQRVQADIDSRRGWEDCVVSTLKTMGIAQNIDKDKIANMPFEDASTAEYPMLIRASIQYIARSVPEILPDKPAKAVIIGEADAEREAQSKRAESAINYQLTYLDKGFYNDFRKGEFYKCITGSIFRKLYHDPLLDQNISRLVKPQDFIIHYEQTDFESCNRYTHRMMMSNNELKKLQYYGHYADIKVGSGEIRYDEDEITKEIKRQDGYDYASTNYDSEDMYHTIYEVHCNYDIPGFEHTDEDGDETGIELPYIITIHKETSRLLSIRRNWKKEDPKKHKMVWFVHYQFLPGTGFYGFGYAHLIGSLARASTALLRATLDGTALHLLKGGFKTADAKIDGDKCISPGEFRTLEGTYDDIRKALYPLEFAAPSPQVIGIIQFMDKIASEVVANTEVMVGSAKNTGPVGTTLALIEQGQKIYSSIHQATHRSFGEELRLLAKLNFEYFPEQFEFASATGASFAYREDFNEKIRIIPVSDPNIASFQQRQAIDQATLQMATQFPDFFKMDKIIRRIMENLNVPALDEVMYTPEEMQQKEQQAQEMQAQEQANMPPPVDPVQVQMALQQQKIDGDLAKEQLKFENEQELKMQNENENNPAGRQDLQSLLNAYLGGNLNG